MNVASYRRRPVAAGIVALLLWAMAPTAFAQSEQPTISMSMSNASLSEVMAMLSMQERVNILLSDDVDTTVSFNLYDVTVSEAIEAIASAAGYAVERRGRNYFVIDREDAGRYATGDLTQVRTYKLQYADPTQLQTMLSPYLSEYGQLSVLAERMLITIEDTPEFLVRFDELIRDIDHAPQQILIEAKILEIALNAEDSYGIDWSDLFSIRDAEGIFGTQGLLEAGGAGSAGFFLTLTSDQLDLVFNALEARGQVRTLSTPKLLALENQEASVIVGDRRGFQVTTTINQVTSETIEFLESGVILRVTPQVDANGHVLLDVHPEVSTGNVDANGIPSQVTTEVTTQLLVPSGRTVFIGGLIKHTSFLTEAGVPVLRRIPGLRRVFGNENSTESNSETIVLITPRIVDSLDAAWNSQPTDKVDAAQRAVDAELRRLEADVSRRHRDEPAPQAAPQPASRD